MVARDDAGTFTKESKMLSISRKLNETVMIGDDVVVIVTKLGKGRVQLCIDAPKTTRITRGKIEPKEATDSAPATDGLFNLVAFLKSQQS